jgi:hypothetical protein
LTLDSAHLGVQGFCPECQVPIIAKPGPTGDIGVQRLDQTPSLPDAAASRPLPRRGPSLFLVGFAVFALIVALLAAAAVSLRRSGRLFEFARPVRIIPELVPVASAPMEITAPGALHVPPRLEMPAPPELLPESEVIPKTETETELPTAPAPAPDPSREARLASAAEKALLAFMSAERPWEKLIHVLEPEEDLLSILDFKKLDPIASQAPIRELETFYVEPEKRWISLATLPEKDGSLHTLCLVHQSEDGTAKLDFSLYWQNRSDILLPFIEGEPKAKPLIVRAELRRLPAETPGSELRLSIGQAYASFAPVEISVPAALPIAAAWCWSAQVP